MVGDILQPTHLLFVLVVALLVLGPKRLPEVGRQLGNGLRDFREAISGDHSERRDEPAGQYVESAHHYAEPPDLADEAPMPETHEFAHETPDAAETTVREADGQPGEHEFAYETPDPVDKRVEPLD